MAYADDQFVADAKIAAAVRKLLRVCDDHAAEYDIHVTVVILFCVCVCRHTSSTIF